MFTGIIEHLGTLEDATPLQGGRTLTIAAGELAPTLRPGDSIAVDGVCLTVVAVTPAAFRVEAIGTTLSRTTLAEAAPGRRFNLEQAMRLGDRLGGHLVQGHVDGVGTVRGLERHGEHVLLDVALPPEVADATVLHGSIAINGVSLTVNAMPAPDVAQIALIPYTWEHTNLCDLVPGAPVNLEGDLFGKFVAQYMARRSGSGV